jgi:hypothetical protein
MNQIQKLTEDFVSSLSALLREQALNSIGAALSGTPKLKGAARRVPPPAKGQKRSPEALEQLTSDLRGYIAKNPGQRIEQIGKGMGVATKELALPARKLIAAGQVRTKGQKRATTYSAR